jgi:transposase
VALAEAVEVGCAQSEVAAAHGVSWPRVAREWVTPARSELTEPEPTRVLGMDEVRFGRVQWLLDGVRDDGTTWWRRRDPWVTGFVDLVDE